MTEIKTLGDYVEKALHDSRLKRTTHTYIADMVKHWYKTPQEIFPNIKGSEEQIERICQYFLSSANIGTPSQRLLLLVSPHGAGKSTMCDDLITALRKFCTLDEGLAYAVTNCPFHQHPFDLIPPATKQKLGIVWHETACPCPICEMALEKTSWEAMPVTRFYYGPRRGIAKHISNDQRREDITEFLGSIDYSKLMHVKGGKASPDAFNWEGKVIWSNRGIFYWNEIHESRRQLLTCVLTLTQEKEVVYPHFPTVHVDTAIIGATNWGRYEEAKKDKVMEPLFGRAHVIELRYTLDPKRETEMVKHHATKMNNYCTSRQEQKLCLNEPVLREYLAKSMILTRISSGGKTGLAPRVTLDIFSQAYNHAAFHKESCISFETYCKSYDDILLSEALKNPDLSKLMESGGESEEKIKENFKKYLLETVITAVGESTEYHLGGQNKYLEYITILEKKIQQKPLTEYETFLAKFVAELIPTESGKGVANQGAFELMMAERLDEFKKIHYTQNGKLRYAIDQLISDNVKSTLRNIKNEDYMEEKDRLFLNDMIDIFARKEKCCNVCAKDLLYYLGENI